MIYDELQLNFFLKFGYFPYYDDSRFKLDLSDLNRSQYADCDYGELLNLSFAKFIQAIDESFDFKAKHVVPLSGGLDSRAILGALLEFTEAENIFTYTFGTPKSLDFEIGNLVAKTIGTKHVNFALSDYGYDIDDLINVSGRIDHQTVMFHHPPVWLLNDHFCDHIFWSGFIGDAICGSHFMPIGFSQDAAIDRYFNHSSYVRSLNLSSLLDRELQSIISRCSLSPELLSYDEQILYSERVMKFTGPHVLMRGFKYRTPFINNDYMRFMLTVDDSYRNDQKLYKQMLISCFPELFAMPVKNYYGLPLSASRPRVVAGKIINRIKREFSKINYRYVNPEENYTNLGWLIRMRPDIKNFFYNNLMDLSSRGILNWIDMFSIWRNHLNGICDHADALKVLVSLEIHLKAQGV